MKNRIDLHYMPEKAKSILQILSNENFIKKYVLVGGTALSIQIKHRISEDLDFVFDGEKLNTNTIIRNVKRIFPEYRIIKQDYDYQIDFVINDTKLTFFSSGAVLIPFSVKEHSFAHKKLNVASIETIAALKLSAISQRNTIRDYYDLYFISKYVLSLKHIIEKTKALIPNLSPITYTETLVYTKDIEETDLSQHLSPVENLTKEEIAAYFKNELRKIL